MAGSADVYTFSHRMHSVTDSGVLMKVMREVVDDETETRKELSFVLYTPWVTVAETGGRSMYMTNSSGQ